MTKTWIPSAVKILETCLGPVPHECNELDWIIKKIFQTHAQSKVANLD